MRRLNATHISVILIVLLCTIIVVNNRVRISAVVSDWYEDVAFALDPSAVRAFTYAERHFRSTPDRSYDVNRAHAYYLKTVYLDPQYPMAFHQLARTSYILGHMDVALSQISLQLQLHPDSPPSSYYVRGLIYGFMGKYAEAAADYETYLSFGDHSWPGYNDYAWILLRQNRPDAALAALDEGLHYTPGNAWLLNSKAIALYELGNYRDAESAAIEAQAAASSITAAVWVRVNPGNNPAMAQEGIEKLRQAIASNRDSIARAVTGAATSSAR